MDLQSWEQRSEWPLVGAAIAFGVGYIYVVLAEPTGGWRIGVQIVLLLLYLVFVVDYVTRLVLAPQRGKWFVRHLFDLALVVLPMFRPLRILRVFTALAALQKAVRVTLRGRVSIYVTFSTVLIVVLAAVAMLDSERHAAGATITTFGRAIWWAVVTITTVGYGDETPVTMTGRLVATATMVAGIALLGTITATLASWFVQRISDEEEANQTATRRQVADLTVEVRELRMLLAGAAGAAPVDSGTPSDPVVEPGR
jgi:voltage-gated potassium channel